MRRFLFVKRGGLMAVAVALVAVARVGVAQQQVPAAVALGTVRGVVRDESGLGIAGARVTVAPNLGAVTDSTGAFVLRGVPKGGATLVVRRLGYSPLEAHVDVADAAAPTELTVKPIAAALPAVRVQARAAPYQSRLAGFYERREKKLGYYITREQIDRSNDFSMTAALRRLPGIQVYTMRGALGRSVHIAGAQCPPLVFVDGFAATLGSFDLDMIDLQSVEGVEVYSHSGSVPPDFATTRGSECGVIAIWSRPSRPRQAAQARGSDKPDVAALIAQGSVFLPDRVDEQAVLLTGSAEPAYPDSLFNAGVSGHVVAQFVVDTAGSVENETVEIVSSTLPAFGTAVRLALRDAQFEPAKRGGTVVRELVSVPFDFDPKSSSGANARPD